jgi:hypothetical protein
VLLRTINYKMDDPKRMTENVPKTHGYGNITRIFYINPNEIPQKYTWDDIMNLVLQSYNTTQ